MNFNFADYLGDLTVIGPELVLCGTILILLLADLWRMGRDETIVWLIAPFVTVLLCLGLFLVGKQANETGPDAPYSLLPEFCGIALAYAAVTVGDVWFRGRDRWVPGVIVTIGTLVAIYRLVGLGDATLTGGTASAWGGLVTVDAFGLVFRALLLVSLLLSTVLTIFYRPMQSGETGRGMGEFLSCLVCAHIGGMFLVATNNLLFIFVSLEILSLCSYLQSAMIKGDRRSAEAGLKYVIYGSMASGLMLFGFSLLYALSGSFMLPEIWRFIESTTMDGPEKVVLSLGLLATMGGFLYKLSIVPFHFWTPDTYDGSPTPTAAFLSVGSKAAAFGIMIRFLAGISGDETWMPNLMKLLAFMAGVTMTYGNLAALRQQNLKRMLAYSSIAHAGYMMMGIVALTDGYPTVLFYLAAYLLMNFGAFGVVIYLANRTGSEEIDDLTGLGWKSPWVCVALVVFLLSLVGLPPTAGFFAKYYLFVEAIRGGYIALVAVAIINSVISLFYYFRIAKALFLKPAEEAHFDAPKGIVLGTTLFVLAGLTVWLGLHPDEVMALAKSATDSLGK